MTLGFSIKTPLGEFTHHHSSYCPKCGTRNPTRQIAATQDFDEEGWFNAVTLTCSATLCGNNWIEKVYLHQ